MKRLLLVPILLLASCMATQQAMTRANATAAEAMDLARQASEMASNPEVTKAELDAVTLAAIEKAREAAEAAAEIPAAVKEDIAALKETAKAGAGGVLGGGALVDLLAAAAAAIFGTNAARNRGMPGTKRISA